MFAYNIFEKLNTMMKDSAEETNSNYRRIVQRKIKDRVWVDDIGKHYSFAGFDSNNDVVFFSYDDPENKNMKCVEWVTMTIQEALCSKGKIT